jgi:VWFA-related protein
MWPAVPAMRFVRKLLSILIVLAAGLCAQQEPEPATFKAGAAEVRLDVQVSQGRRLIANLERTDFAVRDQSQPVTLSYFGREAEPLSVVLLLDISGSMSRYIAEMSRMASQALAQLRKGDEVAILVYGRRSKLHFDFTSSLEDVARRIQSAPDNPYVGSGTSTNEAVIEAAKLLAPRTGRKAIIGVTDNGGLNYQVPNDTVIESLFAANTIFNAIAVGKAERGRTVRPGANPDFTPTDVFVLADKSGGEALKADRADQTFVEMIERVRTRYALAYPLPSGAASKTFRRVTVELTPEAQRRYPKAQVRVRDGYVAP